mmetsp:Transcript_16242/g.30354  ORF Transcript_16242/g.30354 Transcript_16242/m.30354 type:complete len:84 (-) Transcript_16242:926-1177(-)
MESRALLRRLWERPQVGQQPLQEAKSPQASLLHENGQVFLENMPGGLQGHCESCEAMRHRQEVLCERLQRYDQGTKRVQEMPS